MGYNPNLPTRINKRASNQVVSGNVGSEGVKLHEQSDTIDLREMRSEQCDSIFEGVLSIWQRPGQNGCQAKFMWILPVIWIAFSPDSLTGLSLAAVHRFANPRPSHQQTVRLPRPGIGHCSSRRRLIKDNWPFGRGKGDRVHTELDIPSFQYHIRFMVFSVMQSETLLQSSS
jgi:hypothetical protein